MAIGSVRGNSAQDITKIGGILPTQSRMQAARLKALTADTSRGGAPAEWNPDIVVGRLLEKLGLGDGDQSVGVNPRSSSEIWNVKVLLTNIVRFVFVGRMNLSEAHGNKDAEIGILEKNFTINSLAESINALLEDDDAQLDSLLGEGLIEDRLTARTEARKSFLSEVKERNSKIQEYDDRQLQVKARNAEISSPRAKIRNFFRSLANFFKAIIPWILHHGLTPVKAFRETRDLIKPINNDVVVPEPITDRQIEDLAAEKFEAIRASRREHFAQIDPRLKLLEVTQSMIRMAAWASAQDLTGQPDAYNAYGDLAEHLAVEVRENLQNIPAVVVNENTEVGQGLWAITEGMQVTSENSIEMADENSDRQGEIPPMTNSMYPVKSDFPFGTEGRLTAMDSFGVEMDTPTATRGNSESNSEISATESRSPSPREISDDDR